MNRTESFDPNEDFLFEPGEYEESQKDSDPMGEYLAGMVPHIELDFPPDPDVRTPTREQAHKASVSTVGLHIINGSTYVSFFRDRDESGHSSCHTYKAGEDSVDRLVSLVRELKYLPEYTLTPSSSGWTLFNW